MEPLFSITRQIFLKQFLLILLILCMGITESLWAQDQNYIEENDAYVDVTGEPGQQLNVPVSEAADSSQYPDQFSSGMLNYGYRESLYYQFSGEGIFKDGDSLGATFTNLTWVLIKPLDYKIPPAWGYGMDFLYFSSTSESVYQGEGDAVGSSINMEMILMSFGVKVYFMDPVNQFLHPYFGAGWGVIYGHFDSKQVYTGYYHRTKFNGYLSYQNMGLQIKLGSRYGMIAELKNMRATAETSGDPFDQASGGRMTLVLDGAILGLSGYFRF